MSDPQTVFNQAVSLHRQGQIQAAVQLLTQLNSTHPTANSHFQLGIFLLQLQQFESAALSFEKALKQNPNHHLSHHYLGTSLYHQNQLPDALFSTFNVLNLKPDYLPSFTQIAQILHQLQLNSLTNYFLQNNPHPITIPSHTSLHFDIFYLTVLQTTKHILATNNWIHLPNYLKLTKQLTQLQLKHHLNPKQDPFFNLTWCLKPQTNLAISLQYHSQFHVHPTPILPPHDPPIKVAYISAHFQNYSTSYLFYPLFDHHQQPVHPLLFATTPTDISFIRQQIENHPNFHDISQLDDSQSAAQISTHQPDIAVDLSGPTLGNTHDLMPFRPAPIQINYFGFPGPVSKHFFDYTLADPFIIPPKHHQYYQEKIIHLPHCYQVNHLQNRPSPTSKTNHHLHLVAYCRPLKIKPELFDTWLQLLHTNPNTSLHLVDDNSLSRQHLSEYAHPYSLQPHQLQFDPIIPFDQHLHRLTQFHLCLDTPDYNGGATTSNNLLSGIPVVTLLGNRYVSRMSSSLLTNLGLSELITHHINDYTHFASTLINSPHKLSRITRKLHHHLPLYPLFDIDRFAHNLDQAYLTIWNRHQSNKLPKNIYITDPHPLDSSYS